MLERDSTVLSSGRIPSLDGLRAVAVLLVVFAHVHQTHGFPDIAALHWIGRVGHAGVDVFFVISGFLITTLLIRERKRTGRISIVGFYWRRALRILPAYICLLLVVAGLQSAGLTHLSPIDWLAALTYTVNFLSRPAWEIGHAWSLSIEEHFYLVWPLVASRCSQATLVRVALACLLVCPAIRWFVLLKYPELSRMTDLWTFTRLDSIAAGGLLALLAQRSWWSRRLDAAVQSNLVVISGVIVLSASLVLGEFSGKFTVGVQPSLNAVAIAILLWAAVRLPESRFGRFLNWGPLQSIGVGSYSLYLWQQIFLNPRQSDLWRSFPQNLCFAVVAAVVSYHLIERPLIALKERQANPLAQSAAGQPAT